MNIKNNLPPFYIGQKVVYVTGINMPKDSVHVVKNILKMNCGCYLLDVGKETENYGFLLCTDHNQTRTEIIDNIAWFYSTAFRPSQEAKFPLIKYSKLLEEVQVCEN